MLRSDQLGKLQRLGEELRRLGYYRYQINEMIADLLGPKNIEEIDPSEGDVIIARLEQRVFHIRKDYHSR